MVKISDIMEIMEQIAPKKLAESWDNPGLLVGNPQNEIGKILVALDVSERVIDKAVEINAELIISHHPVIFKPLKKIRSDLPSGRKLYKLIRNNISVFSAHTNLDSATDGVNDVLANKLGLEVVKPFIINENNEIGLGRIGKLKNEVSIDEFVDMVKTNLNLSHIKLARSDDNRKIKKVALCGGAGAEFIERANFLGADVYVTGDVKYHEGELAKSLNIHVIDAGHFGTEYPIVKELADKLKLAFSNNEVEIFEDTNGEDVFTFV